ncbi:GNAT family N-acetyltransferase [Paenibacillus sp. SYP-B3998]|uniref:GNAT family N-acetyltransferase n=1 Tax=Paenibacillus sp. SYP-B3998 TaxID=2678564 RepID=A0A6G4A4Q3_9BACL|nr:N-acetyltransferase [Paenibacillus sp. SYP-B3998]NEW09310.1 GNAT family N-acetyltransferase [Paenibacillus sp. SYP-B3998]
MSPFIIVPYQKEDDEAIRSLLVESFHGKFHSLVNLDDKAIIELLMETWTDDSNFSAKKQMVIKENEAIIGTILLKWKENSSSKSTTTKIDIMHLFKRYGFINVWRFIIGMRFLEYQPKEQECYIEHIAIHSSYRNKGIGTLLLAWSKNYIQNHTEFEQLTLYVSDKNKHAIHLYEKMGFCIEKSKYNLMRHLIFKEKKWNFMAWGAKQHTRSETHEKTL